MAQSVLVLSRSLSGCHYLLSLSEQGRGMQDEKYTLCTHRQIVKHLTFEFFFFFLLEIITFKDHNNTQLWLGLTEHICQQLTVNLLSRHSREGNCLENAVVG